MRKASILSNFDIIDIAKKLNLNHEDLMKYKKSEFKP